METSHLLSASVTPVVLISACGLVALALYNRLGVILARIRAFHQQKIDLLRTAQLVESDESQLLLVMLDSQIEQVTSKAKAIQHGVICLLAAIGGFLVCSLFACASVFHEWFGLAALSLEFLGIIMFLSGIGFAMHEMVRSVSPLEEETTYLKAVTEHYVAKSNGGMKLKIVESA